MPYTKHKIVNTDMSYSNESAIIKELKHQTINHYPETLLDWQSFYETDNFTFSDLAEYILKVLVKSISLNYALDKDHSFTYFQRVMVAQEIAHDIRLKRTEFFT